MPEMKPKPKAAPAAGGGNGKGPEEPKDAPVFALIRSPKMLAQMRAALPKLVDPLRFSRIVMTCLRQTPDLQLCTEASLLGSIMQAAQLGLEPGVLGQCWLLPYKRRNKRTGKEWREATLIVGYRGMAQLAWRSSLVKAIAARAVYESDHFIYDYGLDEIEHKPYGTSDPNKLTHVYAVIHTTSGGRLWEVMTRAEIEDVRRRSAARDDGPWLTDYAEMCKKTVLRRLFKIAPASAEMNRAMQLEDQADTGEKQTFDIDAGGYTDEGPVDDPADVEPAAPPEPARPALPARDEDLQILWATVDERAAEFKEPTRARANLLNTLSGEFGDLRALTDDKIGAAISAAKIVKVDA